MVTMAYVNKVCAGIIEKVNDSQLDYSMNQTPYSIHLSIRKKFMKNSPQVSSDSTSSIFQNLHEDQTLERFRQELLHTRNEYNILYNF